MTDRNQLSSVQISPAGDVTNVVERPIQDQGPLNGPANQPFGKFVGATAERASTITQTNLDAQFSKYNTVVYTLAH
jgi:hypothetical protein